MSIHKYWLTAVLALGMVACGGGGGSGGTPGGGSGGTGGTGGGTTQPVYQMTLQLQNAAGVDIAGNSFAASDTVKLLATLKTTNGVAAANEVVSFAESGSGLLQFMPTAATALTNASGQAVVDIKAKDLASLGATTVTASATVAGTVYSVSRNLSVTAGVGADPQVLAKAVNFLSSVPADKSIVIAGSGGNGRAETAILSFLVVDGTGTPVPGVRMTFETLPVGVVTFNSPTGISDASGVVSAAVRSLSSPTTVAVRATVDGTAIAASSDLLTVTTGPAVAGRFSLAASKFVLNSDIHLDPSSITVAVGDANGNPVADGFAVVATATRGLIGTSSRGGCTTANGVCTLDYRLQSQNMGVGEPILITVSGASTAGALSDSISLYATSVNLVNLYAKDNGAVVTADFPTVTFSAATCKLVWHGLLGTAANGVAAPAGTTLEVVSSSDKVSASVSSGSPVVDSRNGSRTEVDLALALSNATVAGDADLLFTLKAGDTVRRFTSKLKYAACTPAP